MNAETVWAFPSVWLWSQSSLVELDRFTLIKWALWLLVGFFGVFPGIVAYMVWAERKVAARFQDRIGPNRVGPLGLLQPIADAIKLLTKESLVPRTADQFVHLLAPVLILVSAFLVLAVIPFGAGMAPVNLPSGMVYLVAVSSLSPLGIFLAGWSSRNKYSLLGAMRAVAQLVSYEIPQVLSTIPVVLWAGSLSLVTIFDRQNEFGWFILSPPGLLAFMILLVASIAEVNRTPFDLPEAESEIIAGYHTEYSGMRFGLFFLGEYMSVFGVSCLGTALFLGGGSVVPFAPFSEFPMSILGPTWTASLLVNAILLSVFLVKVLGFVFLMFWIRVTLPRMRVDRLMNFAWKYLVPLAIVNVLVAAVWYELVLRPGPAFYASAWLPGGLVNWLIGWLVTGPIVLFLVWFVVWFNGRVRTASDEIPSVTHGPMVAAAAGRVEPRIRERFRERGHLKSMGSESNHVNQSLFVIISALGLIGALGTVLARNLVHAGLFLVAFFFVIACQFVFLEAEFLAAIQVLVYIGAVAILLMFAIMLTRNVQGDDTTTAPRGVIIPALATTLGLLFVLAFGISKNAAWTQPSGRPAIEVVKPGEKPSARALAVNEMGRTVGNELLTRYAVPFEVAGLLLTAGLVGAIALAHRDALEEAAPPRGVAARTGGSNGQGHGEAVLASGPVTSSTPSSGV